MKKSIAIVIVALVVVVGTLPTGATVRVGLTSGTLMGLEYETPHDGHNLAYGVGLVRKNDQDGGAVSVTKYFGDFQRHTNRPYVAARAGWVGSGGGFSYAAAGGYSISMGAMQLLTNINYTDGKYGVGMGATFQF